MRKLIFQKSALLIGLVIITIIGVLLIPVKRPDHFLLATLDKEHRLYQLSSPKIIVVGGSNTIFNIDSQTISNSTAYPVVNMGLHAGLGLMFMLNEIEPAIKKGDIIIIMPEYAQFYKNLFFGGRIVTRLLALDPHYLRYISTRQQFFEIIKGLGLETRSKIVYLLGESADEETYTRLAFNEFGDLKAELVGDQALPKLISESYEIRSLDEINTLAIQKLNDFYARMQVSGANVYLALPAIPVEKYSDNRIEINALYGYLKEKLQIPILYSPKTVLVPARDFYDTYYHLNTNGRKRYTKVILNHLPIRN
ncbi:MAG: hypothetical protein JXR87_06080 [Candidatus Marinimicrobia bacterium]|nr:hypothetical protein [Candidatus Neomarinimicrobiota bacterium]